MTEYGMKLLGAIRRNFELLAEHQKSQPAEVDQIFSAMVTHIRTAHPAALLSFDTGPIGKVDA